MCELPCIPTINKLEPVTTNDNYLFELFKRNHYERKDIIYGNEGNVSSGKTGTSIVYKCPECIKKTSKAHEYSNLKYLKSHVARISKTLVCWIMCEILRIVCYGS